MSVVLRTSSGSSIVTIITGPDADREAQFSSPFERQLIAVVFDDGTKQLFKVRRGSSFGSIVTLDVDESLMFPKLRDYFLQVAPKFEQRLPAGGPITPPRASLGFQTPWLSFLRIGKPLSMYLSNIYPNHSSVRTTNRIKYTFPGVIKSVGLVP